MISKSERQGPKSDFELQTYLVVNWTLMDSSPYCCLNRVLNYNLLLVFLDDIKMCGIKPTVPGTLCNNYGKHCVSSRVGENNFLGQNISV